jgi:hypothetical protein
LVTKGRSTWTTASISSRPGRSLNPQHGDPWGFCRREAQRIREVEVEGDQGTIRANRAVEDRLVIGTAEAFVVNRVDIVTVGSEDGHPPQAEILVELEPHATS